jgi:hypothetical protein
MQNAKQIIVRFKRGHRLNKHYRTPKAKSRIESPETQPTLYLRQRTKTNYNKKTENKTRSDKIPIGLEQCKLQICKKIIKEILVFAL